MPLGLHRVFRRRQAPWWTLVVGLAVTAALGWHLHREAVALDRLRLARRVVEIQSQLDARLEKSEMLLQHLRDYLMLSGESRNPVFARWCYENGLTINCPWILGIAVATNRYEVNARATLPKPSANWTEDDWQILCELMRDQPIECHLALRSDVTDGRQFLPDYDLRCASSDYAIYTMPTSKTWLAGAILGSRLGMSERQTVMLDTNRNDIIGTLFYVPVYRPELAEHLAAGSGKWQFHRCARWLQLSLMIVAPVDFKRLAESVWDGTPADLGVEIFSSTNHLTAETWLNASADFPRAADPNFEPYLSHRQTWPMYGQKFSLFFHTTPLFEAQSPRRLARMSMAAGTLLTLLATALVGVATRARNQQERLTEQIREARDALAAAQRERNKISRDLHDGSIQSLYAIQLGLGHTAGKLVAEPVKAGSELSAVRRELDAVIAEIRQFITAEVATDQPVDFCAVLQALAQRARAGTTAQIDVRCDPVVAGRLSGNQAVQLANIAREALSNSLRHANPQQVEIALRPDGEMVVLEIADNGAGFDPKSTRRNGVGLASMQSRASELKGRFELQSSPGEGTRIVVRVPVRSPEPNEAEFPAAASDAS